MSQSNLPSSWEYAPLGQVVVVLDHLRVPVNTTERLNRLGAFPYYGANGQAGTIDGYIYDGDYALLAEDGGYFDEPSRGVAYRATGKFWVNNHAHVLAPCGGMQTSFLVYGLNAIDWMPYVAGTTRYKLNQAAMCRAPFPLPPLGEQRRILSKVEALTARSRRAKEALDAIPPLLERFRQSVLAAAFRGDLTAAWRAQHPDVEPAEELLKRIRAERRRRWEEDELARMRAKGKLPGDDRWKERYEEPEQLDTTDQPELPEGWVWARISELGENPLAPVQTGPFGAQLHSSEFVGSGVPVIAVGNLTGIGFSTDGLYYITHEKAQQLLRYDVNSGDVLFARSGATLGKVCVAPEYVKNWRMTGHILRMRPNLSVVVPELVAYALWGAPFVKEQVVSGIRGMTRPGYNTELLERIALPLPPLMEQGEMKRLIGAAFSVADWLDNRCADMASSFATLASSILSKAFRGELVPQDPNDEPASVLLERIRAERAAASSSRPARRGPRKRGASPDADT